MGAFLTGAVVSISGNVNANIDYNTNNTLIEYSAQAVNVGDIVAEKTLGTYVVAAGKIARFYDAACLQENGTNSFSDSVIIMFKVDGTMKACSNNGTMNLSVPVIATAGQTVTITIKSNSNHTFNQASVMYRGVLINA